MTSSEVDKFKLEDIEIVQDTTARNILARLYIHMAYATDSLIKISQGDEIGEPPSPAPLLQTAPPHAAKQLIQHMLE